MLFTSQGVILCDPAPEEVLVQKTTVQLKPKAFENGYHGFIPDHALGSKSRYYPTCPSTTI